MRKSSTTAFRAVASALLLAIGIIGTLVTLTAPEKDRPGIILGIAVALGLATLIAILTYAAARSK